MTGTQPRTSRSAPSSRSARPGPGAVDQAGGFGSPSADGSPRMLTAGHPRTENDDVYYQRGVLVIRGADGVIGSASEVVHVSTASRAADAWTVPVSTLRDLAADPSLASYDLLTNPAPRAIS